MVARWLRDVSFFGGVRGFRKNWGEFQAIGVLKHPVNKISFNSMTVLQGESFRPFTSHVFILLMLQKSCSGDGTYPPVFFKMFNA